MKDYTEIFSRAIELSNGVDMEKVRKDIERTNGIYCDDDDEWCSYNWYYIGKREGYCCVDKFGYLSHYFPVALLLKNCPDSIKKVLSDNGILFTELIEPMSCDEEILKKYVISHKKIFNENFLDDGNFSFSDERYEMVLERLETGYQSYIDAGGFTFHEIHYY
ncbi:MAG: hypothetical protein K2J08_03920 [Ruminococcus sp.]|nr:hypothetical protein [Ruminococcus sp.]